MAFLIGGANSAADTGFNVDNSCRFDRASNPHMTKTQSDGDRDKWTFSCWFKLGSTFGAIRYILTSKIDGSNYVTIEMDSADKLRFGVLIAGSYDSFKKTNRVFRDVASWMHLVCVYDSENGTAGHRQRVYINGVEETSWASDNTTTQNQDSAMNYSSADVRVGNLDGESSWWDGYLAEVCLVDGSALAPTAFGEFDEDSPTIWKPIDVSGLTFGNNGFYLDMKDSSNLGNDANGGTDLTEANLAAADQATDTCTNNFCTMNPLDNFYKAATFSEGNLRTVGGASSKNNWITSTFALSKGKWYCEMVVPDVTTDHTNVSWGISDIVSIDATSALGDEPGSAQCGFRMHNGDKRLNDASTSYGNSYSVGQVIGMTVNLDDSEVKYFINNTVQNSDTAIDITAVSSTRNGHYFIACGDESDVNGTLAFNFGGCSGFAISSAESDGNGYGAFEFAPPSGFFCDLFEKFSGVWIMAYTAIDDPESYFQTVLYTGNATARDITLPGTNDMQPDIVWIKERSAVEGHKLFDSVRGATNLIQPSAANLEQDQDTSLTAFNSDGFSLGIDSGEIVNDDGVTNVAWCWKESATAGCDIVGWTGNATARTISHSLSAVPHTMIVKLRPTNSDWRVYHQGNTSAPETDYLRLNENLVTVDSATVWNDTAPTSSVFSVGTEDNVNKNTETVIGYLWSEKQGFSKFGTYTGNGNVNGPHVYLGFRPAFVMIKNEGNFAWCMFDNKRGYNGNMGILYPHATGAEEDGEPFIDLLSNGFKSQQAHAHTNQSGVNHVYWAFAESPLVNSNGVPNNAR